MGAAARLRAGAAGGNCNHGQEHTEQLEEVIPLATKVCPFSGRGMLSDGRRRKHKTSRLANVQARQLRAETRILWQVYMGGRHEHDRVHISCGMFEVSCARATGLEAFDGLEMQS